MTLDHEDIEAIATRTVQMLRGEVDPKTPMVDGKVAMQILGCGKTKLQELRKSGVIKHTGTGRKGENIRYDRASLIAYLKSMMNKKQLVTLK